jgi:succinate dehydrogenase/fumarate reductase flavoprotein subunit
VLGAAGRSSGFPPRWVTHVLNAALLPYFVLEIKHADRLTAALTTVEFLRDHCLPKLRTKDAHDVRLALEAENLVTNAEMKLRTSLFRTESRGRHYREDFPRRQDPEWLAWVVVKKTNGAMSIRKEPLPEAWWPETSQSYEQRYPFRFPGE